MLLTTTETGCPCPTARAAYPPSTDQALLARIARGDEFAMRTLFARHQTAVYRWLMRLVRNEAIAEDLLSEVFLDVWRQAGSFQGRSSVSTWLLAIARYKALSARRRRVDDQLDDTVAAEMPDPADDLKLGVAVFSPPEKSQQTRIMAAIGARESGEWGVYPRPAQYPRRGATSLSISSRRQP